MRWKEEKEAPDHQTPQSSPWEPPSNQVCSHYALVRASFDFVWSFLITFAHSYELLTPSHNSVSLSASLAISICWWTHTNCTLLLLTSDFVFSLSSLVASPFVCVCLECCLGAPLAIRHFFEIESGTNLSSLCSLVTVKVITISAVVEWDGVTERRERERISFETRASVYRHRSWEIGWKIIFLCCFTFPSLVPRLVKFVSISEQRDESKALRKQNRKIGKTYSLSSLCYYHYFSWPPPFSKIERKRVIRYCCSFEREKKSTSTSNKVVRFP